LVNNSAARPLVVIAGPTASGKSHLAIRLAIQFSGEIVNCDSLQLYRGFDIGTAKPSPEELASVPHHLIGVLDPEEQANAGHWARLATGVIEQVSARAKLPIIAGGTGFYLRALLDGLAPGPERDPELRCRLSAAEARRKGFLYRLLRRLDGVSAGRIHANDINKLTRSIEICLASGRPASNLFLDGRAPLQGYRALKLVLSPPREALHRAIAARTAAMWSKGLVEEVRGLLASGVKSTAKPFESLGYKETLAFIEERMSPRQAVECITTETRQYAKRQMTWFRREHGVCWLNGFGTDPSIEQQAVEMVSSFLA
jgi:tRNA dimethylallyltransferase